MRNFVLVEKMKHVNAHLDVLEPVGSRRVLDERNEMGEVLDHITENGDLSFDDLVHVLGLDLKVDDTTSALSCCGSCCRRKFWR